MKVYHKQTCLPLGFSKIQALSLSFLLLFAGNLVLFAQSIKGRVYALMFSFAEGFKYWTEQLDQVIAFDRNVLTRNSRSMFYVNLSYNINWGRSIFQSNKRLQNADRMNSILKVNDN